MSDTTIAPVLMDTEQCAAYLNVSPRHIERLTANHGLPVTHVGRYVRFRREAVDQWIEERTAARARPRKRPSKRASNG